VEDKKMKTSLLTSVYELNDGSRKSATSVKKTHTRNQLVAAQIDGGETRRRRGGRSQNLRWKLIRETERFLSNPQSRPWALAGERSDG
jgi:hypothetical protein